MSTIRQPAVAGRFYPGDPRVLGAAVDGYLSEAGDLWDMRPKAIIAPHAGYVFSGAIAGTAFAAVRALAHEIRRVVLLAPAHRLGFPGLAVPAADAFATPLGHVPVDRDGVATALAQPGVQVLDAAFDGEHALEVELPFLQRVLQEFRLVPLLVGSATAEQVDGVLSALWGGAETLIVISSDLSHYNDDPTARKLDGTASRAIETIDPAALNGHFACGYRAITGLLLRARALDLRATTLDLRNSGDAAVGSRDRVVGYGAYAFEYAEGAQLPAPYRERLMGLVHRTLERVVAGEAEAPVDLSGYPLPLRAVRNTFVTLELNGRLRGCVGTIQPMLPLAADVAANTRKAAVSDRRFKPLTKDELPGITASISILSHNRPLAFTSEADLLAQLRPGVDGLIIRDGDRRALFLPKVWDTLPDGRQFLAQLKSKAGLAQGYWSDTLKAWRFTTETFGDRTAG
ncbi:MAG: AmmeMemoRadiSam system protein B [Rhodospirillaceae bacterium]|nr:AmmeMemoRadiSam system protein B [Rhodospirillaceae bacterium]